MSQNDIIKQLKQVTKSSEVYHKTVFECNRQTEDGRTQEVIVEILDAASEVDPRFRYQCSARREDGKEIAGNPAPTINEAISEVHWHELDAQ